MLKEASSTDYTLTGSVKDYRITRQNDGSVVATHTRTGDLHPLNETMQTLYFNDYAGNVSDLILSNTTKNGFLVNDFTALSVKDAPKKGMLTLGTEGSIGFTPYENAFGADSFTIELLRQDNTPKTVTLEVADVASPDDVFIATDSNDAFNGGDGTDTIILSDSINDYYFKQDPKGDGVLVENIRTGDVDTIQNIEIAQFSDLTSDVADLVLSTESLTGQISLPVGATLLLSDSVSAGRVTLHNDGSYIYTPYEKTTGTDSFSAVITYPDQRERVVTLTIDVGTQETEISYGDLTGEAIDLVTLEGGINDYWFTETESGDTIATNRRTNSVDIVTGAMKIEFRDFVKPLESLVLSDTTITDQIDVPEGAYILMSNHVSKGRMTIKNDGSFVYKGYQNQSGADDFAVDIYHADGQVETVTVTVDLDYSSYGIAYPNSTPEIAGEGLLWIGGGESRIITEDMLLEHASDAEGESLSVTSLQTSHGTLVDNGNGTWTYTPEADYKGRVELSYGVSDGINTVEAGFNIVVEGSGDSAVMTGGGTFEPAPDNTAVIFETPLTAAFPDGGFMTAWSAYDSDSDTSDIYGQVFDDNGQPTGERFHLVDRLAGNFYNELSSITPLKNGSFVISWQQTGPAPVYELDIYTHVFDATGTPIGTALNSGIENENYQSENHDIVALQDGGFVMVYNQTTPNGTFQTYTQRYDDAGQTVGTPQLLSTTENASQTDPQITEVGDGGFVAVWQDNLTMKAQLFDQNGVKQQTEIIIGAMEHKYVTPQVASLADGGFLVFVDSDYTPILKRYDSEGTYISESQTEHYVEDITPLADGGFFLLYNGSGVDPLLYGQRYDIQGNPVGDPLEISGGLPADGVLSMPVASLLDTGDLLVTWTAYDYSSGPWAQVMYSQIISFTGDNMAVIHEVGDSVLVGGEGNDVLIGDDGADTFRIELGGGLDRIRNFADSAEGDVISFGDGISHDQLWFQQLGDDLQVSILGTEDGVIVEDWFDADGSNQVDAFEFANGDQIDAQGVQALIDSMAVFNPPAIGDVAVNDDAVGQTDFVYTTMPE